MIKSSDLERAQYLIEELETLDLFLKKYPGNYKGINFEPIRFGSEKNAPELFLDFYPPDLEKDIYKVLNDTIIYAIKIYRESIAKKLERLGVELEND